jgi:hypothetical protein
MVTTMEKMIGIDRPVIHKACITNELLLEDFSSLAFVTLPSRSITLCFRLTNLMGCSLRFSQAVISIHKPSNRAGKFRLS